VKEAENNINTFAETAHAFCSWLENDPHEDAGSELFTALCLLSSLYSSALQLPEIPTDQLPKRPNHRDNDRDLNKKVMARLDRFPLRQYWRVEHSANGNVTPFEDDIARDLYLSYAAVKSGLVTFEQGQQYHTLAAWSWHFSFWLDWGHHSSNAIQGLHNHFHEQVHNEE